MSRPMLEVRCEDKSEILKVKYRDETCYELVLDAAEDRTCSLYITSLTILDNTHSYIVVFEIVNTLQDY